MYNDVLIAAAILLFAHPSFDRELDYGLKLPNNFKNTHPGSGEKLITEVFKANRW